jgi:hypothetical protein
MHTEPTMDATRRMLLKQNKIDNDEEEVFPIEDLDLLVREFTKNGDITKRHKMAKTSRDEKSTESLLIIPSIMRTKRRRRTSSWLLNSIHHPRLPLLTLGKLYVKYLVI